MVYCSFNVGCDHSALEFFSVCLIVFSSVPSYPQDHSHHESQQSSLPYSFHSLPFPIPHNPPSSIPSPLPPYLPPHPKTTLSPLPNRNRKPPLPIKSSSTIHPPPQILSDRILFRRCRGEVLSLVVNGVGCLVSWSGVGVEGRRGGGVLW